MHKEEERVKTFNNHWPLNTQDFALGLALARNGFYHFGNKATTIGNNLVADFMS